MLVGEGSVHPLQAGVDRLRGKAFRLQVLGRQVTQLDIVIND